MLQVGTSFGEYKVMRSLGKGGMGEVWLLSDSRGRHLAAKILDPKSSEDDASRARFLREAELAMQIKSPSLVRTFDVGQDPATRLCYILMEYVGGGSLRDVLDARGSLSVNEALEYAREIAEILEEVREKGVVHRDIKPDNIMFSCDGRIKLADLGIARDYSSEKTTITATGAVLGTPAYMAPEQMVDSHKADTRSDIYSLGIVLFEMLAGERPNHNATIMQLMAKAAQGTKIVNIRTIRRDVPRSVSTLINKMCAAKPSKRYSTPGKVAKAITKMLTKPKKMVLLTFIGSVIGAADCAVSIYGICQFTNTPSPPAIVEEIKDDPPPKVETEVKVESPEPTPVVTPAPTSALPLPPSPPPTLTPPPALEDPSLIGSYPFVFPKAEKRRAMEVAKIGSEVFASARALMGLEATRDMRSPNKLKEIQLVSGSDQAIYTRKNRTYRIGAKAKDAKVKDAFLNILQMYDQGCRDDQYELMMRAVKSVLRGDEPCSVSNDERFLLLLHLKNEKIFAAYFKKRVELYERGAMKDKMSKHDMVAVLSLVYGKNLFAFCREVGLSVNEESSILKVGVLEAFEPTESDFDFMKGRK